jgi:hypothetical protein
MSLPIPLQAGLYIPIFGFQGLVAFHLHTVRRNLMGIIYIYYLFKVYLTTLSVVQTVWLRMAK